MKPRKPFINRRSVLIVLLSIVGSQLIVHWATQPFFDRRVLQQKLRSDGAFAVAFGPSGSVTSVRFRGAISDNFPEDCPQLAVVDLKGVHGARKSLQALTRLKSLRMVILSGSDVVDEDISLLTKMNGLKHLWLTNTALTDDCIEDLARIVQLEIVKIDNTKIGDSGINRLQQMRPGLRVEGGQRAVPIK